MSLAVRLVAVVAVAFVAMSCQPHRHDHDAQQQNSNSAAAATGSTGMAETNSDFRSACADDMQKYCASDPRKRRCLRDNMDKLSDSCKTAVNAPRGAGNARGQGIGRLCADDLQKFCANDPKRFRCLKNNLSQLSDACKTAVTTREQQRGGQPANGNP
jgi:hypothetical protein